jgi:lipopolysaccharide/colanic/teichoic acid biosynthesis glycosyltransferase
LHLAVLPVVAPLLKRGFDGAFSILVLIALCPLMLVIASLDQLINAGAVFRRSHRSEILLSVSCSDRTISKQGTS